MIFSINNVSLLILCHFLHGLYITTLFGNSYLCLKPQRDTIFHKYTSILIITLNRIQSLLLRFSFYSSSFKIHFHSRSYHFQIVFSYNMTTNFSWLTNFLSFLPQIHFLPYFLLSPYLYIWAFSSVQHSFLKSKKFVIWLFCIWILF